MCSRCKSAHYCDKEHQRAHWATHKPTCSTLAVDGSAAAQLANRFKEYGLQVCEEVLGDEPVNAASKDMAAQIPQEAWEQTGEYRDDF